MEEKILLKTLEIYFRDLIPEAQTAVLELFGIRSPEDANWDSFPIFVLESMDNQDFESACPLGGDIANDCTDCIYAGDYQFERETGQCIRRSMPDGAKGSRKDQV